MRTQQPWTTCEFRRLGFDVFLAPLLISKSITFCLPEHVNYKILANLNNWIVECRDKLPLSVAISSAVCPDFVVIPRSAPCLIKKSVIFTLPIDVRNMFTLFHSIRTTINELPSPAAWVNAVHLSLSPWFILAPCFNKRSAIFSLPAQIEIVHFVWEHFS